MKSRKLRRMLRRHAAAQATPPTPPPPVKSAGMTYVVDADGELNVLTRSGDVIPLDGFQRCVEELRGDPLQGYGNVWMGWLHARHLRRGDDPRDVAAIAERLGHRDVAAIVLGMLP